MILFEISVDVPNCRFWVERYYDESGTPMEWLINGERYPHDYARQRWFTTGTSGVFIYICDEDSINLEDIGKIVSVFIDAEITKLRSWKETLTSDIGHLLNTRKEDHHG